jgi:hypothetical protein
MGLDLSAVDTCVQRLRHVSKDTPVDSSDLNTVTDCLKDLSSVFRTATGGDPLVDELDAMLSRIRYVRAGDVVEPDDHNLKVDAIKKVRDILAKMEQPLALLPWGTLALGYGTTDWFGDLYTPTISYVQVSPFFTLALLDAPTYGSSAYAELVIDYLTAKEYA